MPAHEGWGTLAVAPDEVGARLLLTMLEGSTLANAVRGNGKPCRIRLSDDANSRLALVRRHVRGEPATLTFHAEGHRPWRERVDAVVLAAFCPGDDGQCRWLGIDLDASDHGQCGLADPVHVMRSLAERVDAAGLLSGLVAARSRGGRGRHVFLMLPESVALRDAVIGVAALSAAAFNVARSDEEQCGVQHAFRRADGRIAGLGEAGSVELVPRSTARPPYGWALTLPGAGAYSANGGGVIVDPFEDVPTELRGVPRCAPAAWRTFVRESRTELLGRRSARPATRMRGLEHQSCGSGRPIERIDAQTQAFLDGQAPKGSRNMSAFAASANLLGCGVDECEAERLIANGAAACDLPQREALSAFKSAVAALSRKRRCS